VNGDRAASAVAAEPVDVESPTPPLPPADRDVEALGAGRPWIDRARWAAIVVAAITLSSVVFVEMMRQSATFASIVDLLLRHAGAILFVLALCGAGVVRFAVLEPHRERALHAARSRWFDLAGLSVSVCLGMAPALLAWSRARWSFLTIGGAVPWSDAASYHVGAQRLLYSGSLDNFTGRRPLNAGFYAVRLLVTGDSFWLSMLLQGALVGASIYLLARVVAAYLGATAALMSAAVVVTFALDTIATSMSEPLGLALGCLGTTALLIAVFERRFPFAVCGLFVLTVALGVRAGAYLVLPLAILYFGRRAGSSRRLDARRLALATGAVVAGLAINVPISAAYGDGNASLNGNFAYTLYGLANGGTGWAAAEAQFDADPSANEREVTNAVYSAAIEQIKSHPGTFLRGLRHGYSDYFDQGPYGFIDDPWDSLVALLAAVGIVTSLLTGRRAEGAFFVLMAAGMLASAPFVFDDGGFRVFAATVPLLSILPAVGLAAAQSLNRHGVDGRGSRWSAAPVESRTRHVVAWSSGVAAATLLVGPFVAVTIAEAATGSSGGDCPAGLVPVVGRLSSSAPHASVIDGSGHPRNFGEVDYADFHRGSESFFNEVGSSMTDVSPGQTVALMWNEISPQAPITIVVMPTPTFERAGGRVSFCGQPVGTPPEHYAFLITDRVSSYDN